MTIGIAASQLATMTEDQLYESLGALHKETKVAAFRTLSLQADANAVTAQDDHSAGESFFQRLNRQAHDFFCGGCGQANNQSCLDHLKSALGLNIDQASMITAVAGLLGASLGWSAIVAGIVAAILIKFVLPTTLDNLCVEWKVA